MNQLITVNRDCDATLIPSGENITLIKGTHVRVTQALGGDFTLYINGNLVKISGKDADAIGEEVKVTIDSSQINNGEYSEDLVWEQLRTCFDPEIPVNIVDLGLIYNLSKKDDKTTSAILDGKITDNKGQNCNFLIGEIIKTSTLRILSKIFTIKKPLTILRVSKKNVKSKKVRKYAKI